MPWRCPATIAINDQVNVTNGQQRKQIADGGMIAFAAFQAPVADSKCLQKPGEQRRIQALQFRSQLDLALMAAQ